MALVVVATSPILMVSSQVHFTPKHTLIQPRASGPPILGNQLNRPSSSQLKLTFNTSRVAVSLSCDATVNREAIEFNFDLLAVKQMDQ